MIFSAVNPLKLFQPWRESPDMEQLHKIEIFSDGPGMGYQLIKETPLGIEVSRDFYFSRSEALSAIRNKRVKWEPIVQESDS